MSQNLAFHTIFLTLYSYNITTPKTAAANISPTWPISPPVYHCPYTPPANPKTAILSPALRVLARSSSAAATRSKKPKTCLSCKLSIHFITNSHMRR